MLFIHLEIEGIILIEATASNPIIINISSEEVSNFSKNIKVITKANTINNSKKILVMKLKNYNLYHLLIFYLMNYQI